MHGNAAFSFLPQWPLVADSVFWAGLALLMAGLCGEWCRRVWHIPRISGYGLIGLLAGAAGLHLLNPTLITDGSVIIDVALGLLLFELGSRFSIRWARNNPWIIVTSLAEALLTFGGVLGTMLVCNVAWMTSVVIAGIAMSTSPSVVMQLKNELKSEGQVSERLLTLATLNSIYAVIIVKLTSGWLHQAFYGNVWAAIVQPLYLIAGSLVLAAALAASCRFIYRRVPANNEHSFAMLFGLVLLAIAIAHILNLSTALALLIAGVVFKNTSDRPQLWTQHFGTAGWLLTVILFVLTTITFRWDDLLTGGALAILLIIVRGVSKTVGVVMFARPAGMDWRKGLLLGLSLSPMSALALVLVNDTYSLYPTFDLQLRAIVICAIVILQIFSPIVVQRALTITNERQA